MPSLISARGITKKFGNFTAVDNISFDVKPGSIVGLLGPNGAGKTTTIRMIYTALQPDAGELSVFGLSARTERRAIKERLGVVIQHDVIEATCSCLDNLRLHANCYDIPWSKTKDLAMDLLAKFGLADRAYQNVRSLSGGMKRRLSIAKGLISNPDLLLLDEPTIGLDPQARLALWDMVRAIRDKGTTILLTTHYMDEAEKLCDHIFIVDNGKIIAEGSPSELIARHVLPNLEDVFLHLTGRELRDGQ